MNIDTYIYRCPFGKDDKILDAKDFQIVTESQT